jgi:hypothetical protein
MVGFVVDNAPNEIVTIFLIEDINKYADDTGFAILMVVEPKNTMTETPCVPPNFLSNNEIEK